MAPTKTTRSKPRSNPYDLGPIMDPIINDILSTASTPTHPILHPAAGTRQSRLKITKKHPKPTPFPFMHLPAELQQMVFTTYLTPQPLRFEVRPLHPSTGLSQYERWQQIATDGTPTPAIPSPNRSNILTVSRAFHASTLRLHQRSFNGHLALGESDIFSPSTIRSHTGITLPLSRITSLRIRSWTLREDGALLAEFPRLQTFEMRCETHKRLNCAFVAVRPSAAEFRVLKNLVFGCGLGDGVKRFLVWRYRGQIAVENCCLRVEVGEGEMREIIAEFERREAWVREMRGLKA